MEFGKVELSELGKIDFRLPEDDARTWVSLKHAKDERASSFNLRIGVGAPVWGVKDWVGKVYPPGTPAKDFLRIYSEQFNSIELNSTHYGIPEEATVTRWRDSTPLGFKFNPKFLQTVSHSPKLDANESLTRHFCERILKLKDRLGICFLQLPPHFSIDDLPLLKGFLKQIPEEIELAIEVRHRSFFRENTLVTPYYELLRETKTHTVITDVAGRRDVLHTSLPTPRALVRFIGNAPHESDESRLTDWVKRLNTWLKLGLEQIEFFVHQPDDKLAPEMIGKFIDQLNAECGLDIANWKPPRDEKPKQMNLFSDGD